MSPSGDALGSNDQAPGANINEAKARAQGVAINLKTIHDEATT